MVRGWLNYQPVRMDRYQIVETRTHRIRVYVREAWFAGRTAANSMGALRDCLTSFVFFPEEMRLKASQYYVLLVWMDSTYG